MIRLLGALLLFALVPAASWADEGWLEDFDTAKKAAAASGKPILVDITGSDWCPPCQQMEAEVFSRSNFLPAASSKYVLLRLDYPRNTAQPEKIRAQNKQLADRYPFEGFPTFLLMDAQGMLFGQHTGYLGGGVQAFLTMTKGLETQKTVLTGLVDAVKKAAAGPSRAKAQDALFRQAEAWSLVSQYGDLPLKIVQEDKDNQAGLKARYQVYNAYNRLLATWAEGSDYRKAAADLEALAAKAEAWPDLRQRLLFTEGMVWWNALNDEARAKEALTRARALGKDTEWGARAAVLLDQLP